LGYQSSLESFSFAANRLFPGFSSRNSGVYRASRAAKPARPAMPFTATVAIG
jgi:hypothetical protein